MAGIAPFAGSLSDRVRPGLVATGGVAIALVAGVMAAFLGAGSSLVVVALVFAVQGVGFAFFSSPNMAMAMNSVPRERSGLAGALTAAARSLGMVLGMLIVGALVSVNLGHEPVGADPARFIATMQAAFWLLAAVTALALAISAWRATRE